MLPGMTCVSGPIGTGLAPLITDWFTTASVGGTNETVVIPMRSGYTKARISCIGPGSYGEEEIQDVYDSEGNYSYTQYYAAGGAGGNFASSIIAVTGLSLTATFASDISSVISGGSTAIVRAYNGAYGLSSDIGDLKYVGGQGSFFSNRSGGYAYGGAAASPLGSPVGRTPGAFTWTRTSDKAIAGPGTGNSLEQRDYGGGWSNFDSVRGRGLVVVEWGIDKPY